MVHRSFRRDCRGQVIVITALLVSLILLATAMYVIEIEKSTPTVQSNDGVPIDSYSSSVRSTLISALANVSGGGDASMLASDMAELKSVILAHSYESQLTIDYSLLSSGGYSNGIWISKGTNGVGVSSAYAAITCHSSNSLGSSEASYVMNVTSRMAFTGAYIQLNETHKEVNLTLHVYDESGAALANSFVFSYQNGTALVTADQPQIVDSGNGTYTVTFYALTNQIGESLDVSTVCLDTRGIFVGANLTCSVEE